VSSVSFFRAIRLFYWKIFTNYFFYHNKDLINLKSILGLKNTNSISIGNGLQPSDHIVDYCSCHDCKKVEEILSKKPYIGSIARLDNNRFLNCVPVLSKFINDVNCNWIIAGKGSSKDALDSLVEFSSSSIFLIGELSCESAQKKFISNSVFIFHSGTVGLHVLNAYRFNKRILIPSDFNLYSVEAEFCIELLANRYNADNLYSLLDLYYHSPLLSTFSNSILLQNNTHTMSKNIIDFLNFRKNT